MKIEGVLTSLVMIVSFYLYYIDKKKEEKELSEKNKGITESYKKKYKPFDLDSRLPIMSKDGFELEDIALTATEIVYEASIPNEEEINSLVKGDLVKLKFIDKNREIERMWVEYLTKEDGLHLGIVRNDFFDNNLPYGNHVYFHSNHIFIIRKN